MTKNIMIVGGRRIGYYLADALSKKKYAVNVTIGTKNAKICINDSL